MLLCYCCRLVSVSLKKGIILVKSTVDYSFSSNLYRFPGSPCIRKGVEYLEVATRWRFLLGLFSLEERFMNFERSRPTEELGAF